MGLGGLWVGPTTPVTAPRGAPAASRTASRALKSLPRQVHNGPEWPQDGSGGRQDGSRWSQGAPEHQHAPTTPPRDSKRSRTRPQRLPRGPPEEKNHHHPYENLAYLKKCPFPCRQAPEAFRWSRKCPERPQEVPQRPPGRHQERSRASRTAARTLTCLSRPPQDGPEWIPDGPGGRPDGPISPRRTPDTPRRFHDGPKRLPKASRYRPEDALKRAPRSPNCSKSFHKQYVRSASRERPRTAPAGLKTGFGP